MQLLSFWNTSDLFPFLCPTCALEALKNDSQERSILTSQYLSSEGVDVFPFTQVDGVGFHGDAVLMAHGRGLLVPARVDVPQHQAALEARKTYRHQPSYATAYIVRE